MSKLTDATNYEVESATFESELNINGANDKTDEVEVSRWSKKGDRLYINGPAKWDKNSTYFDLEVAELVDLPGSRDVTIDVEGETVTLTVEDSGSIGADKAWTISLSFEASEEYTSEDDGDGDEDEPEIACDGGKDVTEHADDETIEDAIDRQATRPADNPLTVEDVRDLLSWMHTSTTEFWGEWMDNIEHGEAELVAETDELLILDTGEHAVYEQELEVYNGDVDADESAVNVIQAIHHSIAREHCDYDWSVTYPFVIRKPADFGAGQAFVESVVNGLQRRGLSPGQAWAYYGVEIRGESMNRWGKRKGDHDHKNVSDALGKAKRKLP